MFGGGASVQLFKLFGFRVGVHYSWFLVLFVWILWLREPFDRAVTGEGQGFLAVVVSAFLFFGSIVLHELGHALAARREGIGVGGIDLFFFGGFMRADRDSETPGEEFRVAAAGPAVTLLLTLLFGAAAMALTGDRFADAATFGTGAGTLLEVTLAFTALANALLFVLNMIPAFPLDGGRIARAAVWKATGNRHTATKISGWVGQAFAALMIGYGVFLLIDARGDADGSFSGLWYIILGWMLGSAARAAVAQSTFITRLEGITAGDIMDSEPVTIPAETPTERAYDEFFLRYQGWPWFAVVESDGTFVGLAHRAAVEHAALHEDGAVPVRAHVADSAQVRTDTPLESLITSEPLRRLGALMAVDADGRLRGVVTLDQVSRALQARLAPS
ncbi:site-2 protease family protein [Solirubrobacter sp. CPCC 204708]|uniref:Zinc metalloprotease n=1 Tax=Solirubrobacter deserti TaxID=2282478 RepID=A0ABT4RHW1_9ACTN|nr:site-2 protease family protein [Solirubrobacter deserti]MBE2318763.1 site-2 protease family protein [Solirubrobacter deserti]MDA0138143.1 site-2 protease family protein [Solirubrobacter deserti]